MNLSIIIVNWNVRDLLHQCLKSIFLFTENIDYEIIVIDNNSDDGSVQMLNFLTFSVQGACLSGRQGSTSGGEHDNLQVIFNEENVGFAKANNQGLQKAKGKYVLFMNPDMELVENTPKLLYDYMESFYASSYTEATKDKGEVSACTCQLQYGDGHRQPNIKRDPSFLSQLWILYKLHHFWQPWFLKKYLAKDFDYAHEQEVEQIMGAFVFIRRDIMLKIGGWSEDYFIWWEDLDLCKRLRKFGEKIIYTPVSRVIHYEGRSFAQQLSLIKQKRFNRGMLIYFKKHHGSLAWFILKIANWDNLILAWIIQIFRFKGKTQSKI
ncbi:MAG: glycosyltransferase family 2 protein [Candidatus Falkowbacteria bacterium]